MNQENYEAFRRRLNRAEFWISLAGALLLLACLSSCSFRQEIPLGQNGDWGVVYVGYAPPLGRLFNRNADVPDPKLPGDWKEVVK